MRVWSTTFALPQDLSCHRQIEFAAGRYCARQALRDLGFHVADVPIDEDGLPVWPDAVVGSITHARGFACAAVASRARFLSIGIDSERLLTSDEAEQLQSTVYDGEERLTCRQAGLAEDIFPTVIFCAKETLYKCLFPLTRAALDFRDVQLMSAGPEAVTLRVRKSLSLPTNDESFAVRYVVEDGMVHASFGLPRP